MDRLFLGFSGGGGDGIKFSVLASVNSRLSVYAYSLPLTWSKKQYRAQSG